MGESCWVDGIQLPHEDAAERALLGAVLICGDLFGHVWEALRVDAFYRERHRLIFRALASLWFRGSALDLVLLCAELRRRGWLDRVGGAGYVASLVVGVPRSANWRHYAGLILEAWWRRRVLDGAFVLVEAALRGDVDSVTASSAALAAVVRAR